MVTREAKVRPGVETTVEAEETGESAPAKRLAVAKTYKLYIGGKFPRTESGRYDPVYSPSSPPESTDRTVLANLCRASRKDFRESVVAARAAQPGWANRSAYNRAQILYRIAEVLEGRSEQFVAELVQMGETDACARKEVEASIDRFVYFAGWADKLQQVFSSVNPVSSSHFNFSLLEPTGVVAALAPQAQGLLGLTSVIAPILVGGNSCVVLASELRPLSAITLAEVLHASDVPGGVVNVLTGRQDELLEYFASHMDVNALLLCSNDPEACKQARLLAADNVKRVTVERRLDWHEASAENPYRILDFHEVKTTWHPIGS